MVLHIHTGIINLFHGSRLVSQINTVGFMASHFFSNDISQDLYIQWKQKQKLSDFPKRIMDELFSFY